MLSRDNVLHNSRLFIGTLPTATRRLCRQHKDNDVDLLKDCLWHMISWVWRMERDWLAWWTNDKWIDLPAPLKRWVLQNSRWGCHGRTASRSQGSHILEDPNPQPNLMGHKHQHNFHIILRKHTVVGGCQGIVKYLPVISGVLLSGCYSVQSAINVLLCCWGCLELLRCSDWFLSMLL